MGYYTALEGLQWTIEFRGLVTTIIIATLYTYKQHTLGEILLMLLVGIGIQYIYNRYIKYYVSNFLMRIPSEKIELRIKRFTRDWEEGSIVSVAYNIASRIRILHVTILVNIIPLVVLSTTGYITHGQSVPIYLVVMVVQNILSVVYQFEG